MTVFRDGRYPGFEDVLPRKAALISHTGTVFYLYLFALSVANMAVILTARVSDFRDPEDIISPDIDVRS